MTKCIIICATDDGRILVNAAGAEAAQQYLQDAIEVPSLEEATAMVGEVLGQTGEQPAGGGDFSDAEDRGDAAGAKDYGAEAPEGAEGMPMATEDDAMEAGYKRARKGY
jgi:hypothetical protein